MSKQPPPAPTASTIGPCPTFIQIVGRPGTGSIPSTIAPHDQLGPDFYGNKYVDEMFFFFFERYSRCVKIICRDRDSVAFLTVTVMFNSQQRFLIFRV